MARAKVQVLKLICILAAGAACCYFLVFELGTPSWTLRSLFMSSRLQTSESAPNDTMKMLQRFKNRRDHLLQECQARSDVYYSMEPQVAPGSFLVDKQHHLIFCTIPKNGCSFWKRVFAIVGGHAKDKVVFDMSSLAIHTSHNFDSLARDKRSFLNVYNVLHSSKKIMFVRDPYERLFSGYIDKIFCPCMNAFSRPVIKYNRESWNINDACPSDVTFTEFLQYVTNERSVPVNRHFSRQYTCCFPCHADYDFIGKLETLQEDADFLLREVAQLDPTVVLGPSDKFEETSDFNILQDLFTRDWNQCRNKNCLSLYSRMLRIWTVSQVRGFISVKERFPLSREDVSQQNPGLDQFLGMAQAAYRRSGDRRLVKRQRQQALVEAFRTLPPTLLAKVEQYVADDCRLFDYNCSLQHRFQQQRQNTSQPPSLFHLHEVLMET